MGHEKVSFSDSNSDKTCKLSLFNYNLCELGTGENETDIISDPHDHLCTVRLLKYHIKYNLPPYWQGLLFLRKAKTEELKRRKRVGIKYIVNSDPTSAKDSTPWGKFGPSFRSKKVHQLVIMWKKFTGHSKIRGSISKMATSGVASGDIIGHARHKSVSINTVYQSRNMSTSDHRKSCFNIGEEILVLLLLVTIKHPTLHCYKFLLTCILGMYHFNNTVRFPLSSTMHQLLTIIKVFVQIMVM
jgi:hypothetical protein